MLFKKYSRDNLVFSSKKFNFKINAHAPLVFTYTNMIINRRKKLRKSDTERDVIRDIS